MMEVTARVDFTCHPNRNKGDDPVIATFYRRGAEWHLGKATDDAGRRVRSPAATVLDGENLSDARIGPMIQWMHHNGQPTGPFRERFELECPVCGQRAEVRADNPRFVRILEGCAASGAAAMPLPALKLALDRNI